MTTISGVDYLFDEELLNVMDCEFRDTPSHQQRAPTAFPFERLCGELRNNIYENIFLSVPQIVRINEFGSVVLPSITRLSKQLHAETEGYLRRVFEISTTQIHAQVCDYNPGALMATLEKLSKVLEVPKIDLVRRTKVSIVGELNYDNLHQWIRNHLNDPETTPIFAQMQDGCGLPVFSGRMSLKSFIMQHDMIHPAGWRRACDMFFSLAEEAGWDLKSENSSHGASSANDGVLKLIATFHHTKLQISKAGGSAAAGGRMLDDIAELIYWLHTQCNAELLEQIGVVRTGAAAFLDAINYES